MNRDEVLALAIDRDFQDEKYLKNIVPPYQGKQDAAREVADSVPELPRAIQVMDFDMGLDDEEKDIFEEYLEDEDFEDGEEAQAADEDKEDTDDEDEEYNKQEAATDRLNDRLEAAEAAWDKMQQEMHAAGKKLDISYEEFLEEALYDPYEDYEETEERAMIMDELYGDSESWERSNDEGWYYDED